MIKAGEPGPAIEETMITTTFEPSIPNVKVAARFAAFSLSTASTQPEPPASDREELRWQLEWQRRNVED
jgi:hypothetical protein